MIIRKAKTIQRFILFLYEANISEASDNISLPPSVPGASAYF